MTTTHKSHEALYFPQMFLHEISKCYQSDKTVTFKTKEGKNPQKCELISWAISILMTSHLHKSS